MKLPRVVHLDPSDTRVFDVPSVPGEWAITGSFAFEAFDPATATNKQKIAFASGWLAIGSFGRSTLVQVTVAPDTEIETATRQLAAHIFEAYNAPDMMAALDAARHEIEDARSLCDHPAGTLLAIEREVTDDVLSERVRVLPSPDREGNHARIWSLEPDDE